MRDAISKPTDMLKRPRATIRFVPNFSAARAANGAVTPAPTANGIVCTPALNVSYPRTNWKYCVTRNVKPKRQKNAMPILPVAALNRALLKNVTSRSGASFFDSNKTKPMRVRTPIPKPRFDF